MSHPSLLEVSRSVGDGWTRFVGGAVNGEVLALPGGAMGMAGEPFGEMNPGAERLYAGIGFVPVDTVTVWGVPQA